LNRWLSTPFLFGKGSEKIDEENGIIYGAAIVTEGEAKGHGVFLDAEFVDDVIKLGNGLSLGLKVRFGHPNMSSEALGTYAGRAKNFRRDGELARADIHLSESAKDAPSGDLYTYLLALSKTEPDVFGLSIVFVPGEQYKRDPKTSEKIYRENSKWSAIDGRVFEEISALRGVDFVDDPAANPGGLFNAFSGDTWAGQMTEFLDAHPHIFQLCRENPEIVESFMSRYEEYKLREGQNLSAATTENKEDNMTREEFLQAKSLYGGPVAMAVFENGGTLADCAKMSAENQAKQAEELKAENAKLQAEKAELEKQLATAKAAPAFQEDAKPSEPAKVDCNVKHAEFRAAGLSSADAWKRVAREFPAEYRKQIRKEEK
jgi:hypothetical protein